MLGRSILRRMKVRKRSLPTGWYPGNAEETRREIEMMMARKAPAPPGGRPPACAGILPHAGWHFSGRLALEVLSVLCRGVDTMVIIGGHMASSDRIVCAPEDGY
jgi:AmmeMemoRadiSam system protein B